MVCSTNPLAPTTACAPTGLVSLTCKSDESNSCTETDTDDNETNLWIQCAMNCHPCISVNLNVTAQISGKPSSGVFSIVVPDVAAGNALLASYKGSSGVLAYYERSNTSTLVAKIPLTATPQGYLLFFICLALLITSMIETFCLAEYFLQDFEKSSQITLNIWIGILVPLGICLPIGILAHILDGWKVTMIVAAIVLSSFGNIPLFAWLLSRVVPVPVELFSLVYIWIVALPNSVFLPIVLYAHISHVSVIIVVVVWGLHVVLSSVFVVNWNKAELKALFVKKARPQVPVELGNSNSWMRSRI
ncbi:UNVERIFIED_CONTAM: hypothetical protein HDU68_011110 [Siphonaria sp. JEL0065]|nr:hypothetical protein HDU68_011110 [Siphonaria sp. JEL0065]